VNSLKRQTTLKEPAAEISANLEYPVCPLCESDRREFPFRLSATGRIRLGEQDPYRVARCIECGFHHLYPRLIESVMQEVYRESPYYGAARSDMQTPATLHKKKRYEQRLNAL
jgi:hypothetical protein